MALRSVVSTKLPMVIILGATGTGKTKLGVELAQKFGTEIISADSMQIYKGLDLVTAKATVEERKLVHHHLVDILEPNQMFTVVDFRNRTLKIIDNLFEQNKIPVIVGGTNYYVESIVYKILVENMDSAETLLWDVSRRKRDLDDLDTNQEETAKKLALAKDTDVISSSSSKPEEIIVEDDDDVFNKEKLKNDVDNESKFSNEEIHEKLKAIDPVMASRLHPNNRRKILRSIEVWLKSGRRHSDILAEQKLSEGELRRPGSTIILWLKCEQSVHDERLNARVDSMLDAGLMAELLDFHARHNRQRIKDGKPPDYTKGVFQTLGFKEFHEYLMLTEEQRDSEQGKALLKLSIDNMKMATRRYARRQNKMTKGRFLEHPAREIPLIYELDTTDVAKWDENVKSKAIHIIESYLNKITCKYEPLKSSLNDETQNVDGNSYNFCEVCQRVILGDRVYAIHMNSIRHKKMVKKNENQKKQESP